MSPTLSISQCSEDQQLEALIALFDAIFADTYATRLVRGGSEPLYCPRGAEHPYHRIIFAHGFFASALHEISHWCIAGPQRRMLEDYGYWYLPDGRDRDQQQAFEAAEVAPQAVELLLTEACRRRFNVSADNLGGSVEVDREAFRLRVEARAAWLRTNGLSPRAAALHRALGIRFGEGASFERARDQARAMLEAAGMPA